MDGQEAMEERPVAKMRDYAAASETRSDQTWLTGAHMKSLDSCDLIFPGYKGRVPFVVFSFSCPLITPSVNIHSQGPAASQQTVLTSTGRG